MSTGAITVVDRLANVFDVVVAVLRAESASIRDALG